MGDQRRIRVAVADDFIEAAEGLRHIVSKAPDMEVVGTTTLPLQVVELVEKTSPDVVVLDIAWRGDHQAGLKMAPQIKTASPQTQIVAISAYPELVQLAERAGLHIIKKGFSRDELLDAIRWVMQHPDQDAITASASPFAELTARELEVLNLVSEGFSDQDIADSLVIAKGTVKKYTSNILDKLDVKNRTQAANKFRNHTQSKAS